MTGSSDKVEETAPAPLQSIAPVPLKRQVLGEGLEIWLVPVGMPQEQKINARVMSPAAFNQLADNIRRENRLESLPLCALVDNKLELISGHHRLRAAKKAGLSEIWVLVDTSGLSRDKIKSKQLSHNSLQGMDDADLLKSIYESISSSEARIEAFIQMDSLLPKTAVPLVTKDLVVEFAGKTMTLVFLPAQHKLLAEVLTTLKDAEVDEVALATLEEYEILRAAVDKVGAKYNISSVPTIFAKMAQIVETHLLEQTCKTAG